MDFVAPLSNFKWSSIELILSFFFSCKEVDVASSGTFSMCDIVARFSVYFVATILSTFKHVMIRIVSCLLPAS